MASRTVAHSHAQVERGYQRVLVPLLTAPDSDRAMTVACRLSAEHHAVVTALAVIEVPPSLPLDAHMTDEEEDVRAAASRAQAIGDAFGVTVHRRTVRARDPAAAILERVTGDASDLVVLDARRRQRVSRQASQFDSTVQQVLRKAPCRVLLVAPPA
jgi:nucleotide-binding universal stress UspA family protein